jgi:hypothetical protein
MPCRWGAPGTTPVRTKGESQPEEAKAQVCEDQHAEGERVE